MRKHRGRQTGREEKETKQEWVAGRRFLLNNINITKKEGKCVLTEGGRSVELPPQEVLESMADRYITYGGEADVGEWKRGFTTEAINEIKRGQARRNIKIDKETWDLALDVTGATVQINTTGTTKAQRIQFYTMEEEVELGAIPTLTLMLTFLYFATAIVSNPALFSRPLVTFVLLVSSIAQALGSFLRCPSIVLIMLPAVSALVAAIILPTFGSPSVGIAPSSTSSSIV